MTTFFRSPRGGRCPLTLRERNELLSLYGDWSLTVPDIAEHFDVSPGTVYRWLLILGVRSHESMTPRDAATFERRRTEGLRSRSRVRS
jgi:hypothetical protein